MNTPRRIFSAALAALVATASVTTASHAQSNWPSKTVTLVVPFVAGGGADTIARLVATQLQQRLGKTVVVENKPGAGGSLAADAVRRAPADGHTLMIATNTLITNAAITKTSYDPLRDFTPVTTLGTSPYLLLVNSASEFRSLADLVRVGKAQPDKLSFGSAGNGGITHLLGELLKQQSGMSAQHVPYKGSAAAIVDLIGGQLQFAFADTASAAPHVKSGRLRAIATTAPARSPQMPDVPTLTEAGAKVDVVGFYGLLAPAGLPAEVLAKLNAEVSAVLATAAVKEQFAAAATDALAMPADQFARRFAAEVVLWKGVVKTSGSKFD
ncbi:MAG: tripartite tricarboxylate transporter substrate binding protein [Chitinophagaceae bacterium]|nr:tripartite tricarboxylate transporter substrate binding protein [Rubrivivax sp.]